MTPAARLAASIELLVAINDGPRRPADAVANEFFRARRFIGSGDRRAVSDRAWRVLRSRRRLDWWIDRVGTSPTPRTCLRTTLGRSAKVYKVYGPYFPRCGRPG